MTIALPMYYGSVISGSEGAARPETKKKRTIEARFFD